MTKDLLFISYAWEDQAFAKWLALRLTAEGYNVWIDQEELLGGESWPKTIDEAIKQRSFRLLGLLSKFSISKPNPLKERTLALNMARQPGREGFIIPINVDGISPLELDWMSSDLTFISFEPSWAKGLAQLLKLLKRENCPKRSGDGKAVATQIVSLSDCVTDETETITSNVCPFTKVPNIVHAFRVSPKFEKMSDAWGNARRDWAFRRISPHRVLAFHEPDSDLASWLTAERMQSYNWREIREIEGVKSRDVVVSLLRGSVETRLRRLGFAWSNSAKAFAFPGINGNRVSVIFPNGTTTKVQHSGERTFFTIGKPKTKYRYRLAVNLGVERDFFAEFSLVWRLRFMLTDTNGDDIDETKRLSRRKHTTKNWYNYKWFVRYLASMQSCSDEDGLIRVGPLGDSEVVLDCQPSSFSVDRSINESVLVAQKQVTDEEFDLNPADDFLESVVITE